MLKPEHLTMSMGSQCQWAHKEFGSNNQEMQTLILSIIHSSNKMNE